MKSNYIIYSLKASLEKLREALMTNRFENCLAIDASIRRLGFCIELFWKVFKKIAEAEGLQATTPKQSLQAAYQMKLFDDEKLWLNMLNDRNDSSHTYNEDLAQEIYSRIPNYYDEMQKIYDSL